MNRPNKDLIKIAEKMTQKGCAFEIELGYAMLYADENNRQRIEAAFPELMNQYAMKAGVK